MSAIAIAQALLAAAAPVTALVADRRYPTELPEGVPAPALVLRLVSDVPAHDVSLAQSVVLMRARLQVDAITSAQDLPGRTALLMAARRALHGAMGTVAGYAGVSVRFEGAGPDLPHARAGLAAGSADFFITYLQPA